MNGAGTPRAGVGTSCPQLQHARVWHPVSAGLSILGGYILPQVEQLVEMGADPAAKDAKGLDSMHFAAAHGQLDVVRFLWTKGVELDSEDAGVPSDQRIT